MEQKILRFKKAKRLKPLIIYTEDGNIATSTLLPAIGINEFVYTARFTPDGDFINDDIISFYNPIELEQFSSLIHMLIASGFAINNKDNLLLASLTTLQALINRLNDEDYFNLIKKDKKIKKDDLSYFG